MKQNYVGLVLLLFLFPGIGCGGEEKGVPKAAMDHFVAASKAITAGDNETALRELTASIEEKPSAWAFYQRAKVMLETGKEGEAAQDCVQGLELDPAHRDLKWFAGELKKPVKKRFKGRFKNPPSARK
jgi:hypothetical protein